MDFTVVTKYLDSLKEQFSVRAADCAIMIDHKTVYRHLVGTSDFEDTVPLTEDNLHDVFSASKVLTATAVMQLVEQGKIGLEDPLSKFLPEFADAKVLDDFDLQDFVSSGKWLQGWPDLSWPCHAVQNPIRIGDMLSMTAGFSYNIGCAPVLQILKDNPHACTRDIVRGYAGAPLLFEPGTRYSYSLAHDILPAVVEVVTGMKFSEYMRQNIFAPADADQMFYQIPKSEKSRLTVLYGFDPKTKKYVPQVDNFARINDTYESGGAGIACTVGDYIKVLDALACGGVSSKGVQILKPETIREMSTNCLNERQLADFHIGGKHEYGYALGVRTLLDPTKSKSPIGEFGWDGAAGAYALVDPVNHLSIFYAQAAPESGPAFSTIHPTLRDLVYDAIGQK